VFSRPRFFRGEVLSEDGLKDITWVTPGGDEATDKDWRNPVALTLGCVLGGAAGEFYTTGGQRDIDASFLVMISAYHEDLDFRFPRLSSSSSLAWQALVDTAEPTGLVNDGKLYVAGHAYKLRARSFALFINRAPANGKPANSGPAGAEAAIRDLS
jgi:glycogen operon protein